MFMHDKDISFDTLVKHLPNYISVISTLAVSV